MSRQVPAFLIFALIIAVAPAGNAEMVFSVDAGQDGAADTSWILASGDTVTIDIRVSNIAEPGLGNMGFKLSYDPGKLAVTSAAVDIDHFPSGGYPIADWVSVSGEVELYGNRIPSEPGETATGIAGDDIRLATVTFQRIGDGAETLRLVDRNSSSDDFVTFDDPEEVLDGDIGDGVSLIVVHPPIAGDVNGDGSVDLADAVLTLQFLAQTETGTVYPTGDANGDGAIGVDEGIYILQKAAAFR